MKKIISVVGARPNFMKIAPLHHALKKSGKYQSIILHTGQHYDEKMSKVFFDDLGLPEPDIYLGIGSGSHAEQTAKVMIEFEKVLMKELPEIVIVVGDVNSTLACSIVAAKLLVPVAHVEAGLRSGDRTMPEEINRIVTDSISDLLFVSEPSGMHNLINEGVSEEKMFFVGNIMIDSLVAHVQKANQSNVLKNLGLEEKSYTLVTLHRPSNVDSKESLEKMLRIFAEIAHRSQIVFPIHPRTRKRLEDFGLMEKANAISKLRLIEPQGYIEFLKLMKEAALVLTDSGGIQEETTVLGVQCLTMRENTERPATIEVGTNQLVGTDESEIKAKAMEVLNGNIKEGKIPEKWDGRTADRIVATLDHIFATW
ncbi:UDP-N-acetylglucosamine 2-epimerase [Chloroherpeton thalassium ATCC 35110]|uniref:UDP-N-acetylglucosamine 2-epimerase n=1 Tax=Chloroherpeton thalassium (strain ATCC 35110 / GB-78) TaxID=517418 RepID=B3QWE8_CHLT3|nr:UDP-N-acetylglucosamine 2-epimerase (non-hydrolyzing) [Chloroherpeton thalassium]ACF13261.1 UDP-N-acetylglucosamine 2-epimerase [Chloroherpeton thalassium ATCC 35110]